MTPEQDGSFWAIVLGGGSVLGVIVTKGFDYLKARLRKSTGDRREAESGLGRLIHRLESRLDKTEKDAQTAWETASETSNRLLDCERKHASCNAKVSILTSAINELREKLRLPLIETPGE